MASEKDLGTRKKCFTCNQMMECRKTEHNGETKYQWQDGDGEQAHYKFDQNTQKPYCKNKIPEEPKKGIDFSKMAGANTPIPAKEPTPEDYLKLARMLASDSATIKDIELVIADVSDATKSMIAIYAIKRSVIEDTMDTLGIKHPGRVAFTEGVLK